MISYAKTTDCIDVIPSFAEVVEGSPELEATLAQKLLDASRLFETEVLVGVDYFAKASDEFTTKRFYGDGTQYLRFLPFTEIEEILDAEGEVIDNSEDDVYRVDFDTYTLKWLATSSFCRSMLSLDYVDVSAKWGFACIPEDVKLAVKYMGCMLFLATPQARSGLQFTGDAETQISSLRTNFNRIADQWRARNHHLQLGIGAG
jgi:hypothetical protein